MAHILMVGGSGGFGLETVKLAVERGYRGQAFARSASGIALLLARSGSISRRVTERRDPMKEKRQLAQAAVGVVGPCHDPERLCENRFAAGTRVDHGQ